VALVNREAGTKQRSDRCLKLHIGINVTENTSTICSSSDSVGLEMCDLWRATESEFKLWFWRVLRHRMTEEQIRLVLKPNF